MEDEAVEDSAPAVAVPVEEDTRLDSVGDNAALAVEVPVADVSSMEVVVGDKDAPTVAVWEEEVG